MLNDTAIKQSHANEFRRCLVDCDVTGLMKLWRHVAPQLHQFDEKGTLAALHMARAEANTIPLALRQYSDRWLRERGLGSLLPEHLRPIGWRVRW